MLILHFPKKCLDLVHVQLINKNIAFFLYLFWRIIKHAVINANQLRVAQLYKCGVIAAVDSVSWTSNGHMIVVGFLANDMIVHDLTAQCKNRRIVQLWCSGCRRSSRYSRRSNRNDTRRASPLVQKKKKKVGRM